MVINCLPGIQHVDACLRCVGKFGVYTEVGETNCSDSLNAGLYTPIIFFVFFKHSMECPINYYLLYPVGFAGLYDFLKCVTLRVIRNKVTDLLNLPIDTKIKMRMFLEECMSARTVAPPQIAHKSNL